MPISDSTQNLTEGLNDLSNSISNLFETGWRSKVFEASFRGVKFYVTESSTTIGRRTKIYEPTESNKRFKQLRHTIVTDIGPNGNYFTVTGYVIQSKSNGYNYFKDRDALIEALSKKGEGLLIHPFYGEKVCALVDTVEISETFSEGGIARFTIPFVEAHTTKRFPSRKNPIALLDAIANSSILQSISNFVEAFTSGLATASAFMDAVNGLISTVISATNALAGLPGSLVNFVVSSLMSTLNLVDSILDMPCSIAGEFNSMAKNLSSLGDRIDEVFTTRNCQSDPDTGNYEVISSRSEMNSEGQVVIEEEDLYSFENNEIDPDTGITIVNCFLYVVDSYDENKISTIPESQAVNIEALINMVGIMFLSYASRISSRISYRSKEELIGVRESITERMDTLITRLGDSANSTEKDYLIVTDLRASFIENMVILGEDLASEITYEVGNEVSNALLISYDTYEDVSRTEEIIKRNQFISNPLFIETGKVVNLLGE